MTVGKVSFLQKVLSLTLIFMISFSQARALGNDVLFLSSQAKEQDYAVYLQTKPQYTSYIEYWSERNPTQGEIQHLLEVFERAQIAFLNNPFDEAKALFENVVQLAHHSDWKISQREIIFSAFLRLAQLEPSEESRKHYLRRAIAFDHEMEPNTSLFPPPLINEFKEVRTELRSKSLVFKKPVKEQTSLILLNGKKLTFKKPTLITEGFHRLTIVSNQTQIWTKVLNQKDFENLYVDRKIFASGDCDKAKLHSEVDLGLTATHMFYSPQCIKPLNKKAIQVARDLAPSYPSGHSVSPIEKPEPIWKKSWFWVAVAGVALTAIVISQNNQNQGSPSSPAQPTTYSKGL